MNIGILCIFIAGLQPLIWGAAAKAGGPKAGFAFDNAKPRDSMAQFQGWSQRAIWAMQNAYEAFPLFFAAVVCAMLGGADQTTIDYAAIIYVLLRFVYGFMYIFDKPGLRSTVWILSIIVIIRLFVAAI